MHTFEDIAHDMHQHPRKGLATACAGLIGSNLTEHLRRHDQTVAGLDNLSTGPARNLEDVRDLIRPDNVALGDVTTLAQLFGNLKELLSVNGIEVRQQPGYAVFRAGDIACSQASIGKAIREPGHVPRYRIREGLAATVAWYMKDSWARAG